ncbi:hypothetical protein Gotur_025712 [Gossypium turneri]
MVQCLLNEQPTHETLLAHIFQIRHPIQIPKLVPRMVELPGLDQKHIYRTIYFLSKLCISWIVSWNYSYEQDQYTGIPLLVRNYRTKWWDKFNGEKYDSKYLDNFSTRIQDYVSPQPRIKPQQNSFKQSRQLVRC